MYIINAYDSYRLTLYVKIYELAMLYSFRQILSLLAKTIIDQLPPIIIQIHLNLISGMDPCNVMKWKDYSKSSIEKLIADIQSSSSLPPTPDKAITKLLLAWLQPVRNIYNYFSNTITGFYFFFNLLLIFENFGKI